MHFDNPVSTSLGRVSGTLQNRSPANKQVSFTRPADTTAYAIGDVIYPPVPGNPADQIPGLKFEKVVGGDGQETLLLIARLIDFAAEATRLSADLYLFTQPLATVPADNAAFAPTAADMNNFVEVISFSNSNIKTANGHTIYRIVPNVTLFAASNDADLYGYLVATNAYTPVNAEKFTVHLGVIPQDIAIF